MSNSFINKKVDLTSDATVTLYTVPSATTAIIKSILVSNDSGTSSLESPTTIDITLTDASDAVFSIAKGKLIEGPDGQSGEPVEILSKTLVAEAGEIIKVAASAADSLHVILSAMEVLPRIVTT